MQYSSQINNFSLYKNININININKKVFINVKLNYIQILLIFKTTL